jgi:hypothetical protein
VTSQLLAAWLIVASPFAIPSGTLLAARAGLGVPIVVQTPERCGEAALEMVLRFYGAAPAALAEAGRVHDPVLRGSLITDLAAAARRAGYEADIATLTPDSLVAVLATGIPPIVLYQSGRGPLTVAHFGVVTGWEPARGVFTLNDGGAHPRTVGRDDFAKRWRTAGSQALLIRRRAP